MKRLTAKYKGTCHNCKESILPGQSIYWSPRSAIHVDCQTAKWSADACTSCSGRGYHWQGACPSCDGTGSRKVQEFARAGGHPSQAPQIGGGA